MAIEYFHIKERDFDLVEQLIQIENSSYDSGALDVFDLIAMLRHARVYVAVEYDEILGAVYFMRANAYAWRNQPSSSASICSALQSST